MGLGRVKKSLPEKTDVVKKGGGGAQFFLTKSKNKQFFYASPKQCKLVCGISSLYMLPPSLMVFFVFLLMFKSVLMSVTIREKMIVCKKSRARPLGTISLEC